MLRDFYEGSLESLNDLIERSLAGASLESMTGRRETILLSEFVAEAELAGGMAAKAYRHELTVTTVDRVVRLEADRDLLAMAVANLLHNAFKFTRVPGHVWLRTHATADRVFIEVEDECGGLLPGQAAELSHSFEQQLEHQHLTDRSGIGLSVSRRAIQAHGGDIQVRNLPGKACVFTMALPRKIALASRACSAPS